MPLEKSAILRSRIEIHIPYHCTDVRQALRDRKSCVEEAARSFRHWFEDVEMDTAFTYSYVEDDVCKLGAIIIVLSNCTETRLREYAISAVNLARDIAKKRGLEKIIMVINNNRFPVYPNGDVC